MFQHAIVMISFHRSLLAGWVLILGMDVCAAAELSPARWEAEITAFEKLDQTKPPPARATLFAGSSSIRLWKDIGSCFPGETIVSRGFGGSHMADLAHFADRIIVPYRPRHLLVYEGDNDLAAGRSPADVLDAFQRLAKNVHRTLPDTRITFISIKPSRARWHLIDSIREANTRIRAHTLTDRRLGYVDIFTPMLDAHGKVREELLLEDGLHLSPQGYAVWADHIRPMLKSADSRHSEP